VPRVATSHERTKNGDGGGGERERERERMRERVREREREGETTRPKETHRKRSERVLLLAHSRIFFFSQPSTVFTHSSPGLRQSLDMNGMPTTSRRWRGRARRDGRRRNRAARKRYPGHKRTSSVSARTLNARSRRTIPLAVARDASCAHGFVSLTSVRIRHQAARNV